MKNNLIAIKSSIYNLDSVIDITVAKMDNEIHNIILTFPIISKIQLGNNIIVTDKVIIKRIQEYFDL